MNPRSKIPASSPGYHGSPQGVGRRASGDGGGVVDSVAAIASTFAGLPACSSSSARPTLNVYHDALRLHPRNVWGQAPTVSRSVANGERSRRTWVDGSIGNSDFVDFGSRRSAPAPTNELVDGFGGALRFQCDGTVVAIVHPAVQAQFLGAPSAGGAVSHSLDPAANYRGDATMIHPKAQEYIE